MPPNLIIEIVDGIAIEGFIANANVGASVSSQLRAIGNVGAVSWDLVAGAFPDDLAIAPTTGLVTGTATTAGAYSVTIRATDTGGRFTRRVFSWRVQALPLGIAGTAADLSYGRTDGWNLTISGGLPPYIVPGSVLPLTFGRTLTSPTIAIIGTLTSSYGVAAGASGVFAGSVTVTDSDGAVAVWAREINIEVPALIAAFFSLPDAEVDVAYAGSVEAEGGVAVGAYVYSLDTAPAWMSIDSGTGALTGTPTEEAAGVTVTARVTDSEGNFDTVTDTLDVLVPALTLADIIVGLAPEWYVKLDEPAPHYVGQPCIDYSGNALAATYNAAAGDDAAGLFSGSDAALKFTTSTQILGPTITRASTSEAVSVSYFIKGPATSATRKIIGVITTSTGFSLETTSTGNRVGILTQTPAGNRFTDGSGNVWDDVSHHIAVTMEKTGGKLELRAYTDGVLTFFNDALTGDLSGLSWPLRLGTTSFESTLDELAFWQRKLSAAEVLSIYDARNDGTPYTPGFAGILDAYTTDLYYACSARHLISTYSGPIIRVMRTSDSAQSDIYGDDAGGLDISALTTFVGASDAYVSVWFDQTGNARHITQSTTAGNRGKIVIGGVVQYNGVHPAASYPTTIRDVAPTNTLLGFTYIATVRGVGTSGSMSSTNNSGAYCGLWQVGNGSTRFGGTGITASVDRVNGAAPGGATRNDLWTAINAAGANPFVISSSRTVVSQTWKNDPFSYTALPTAGVVTDRVGYSTDSVASLAAIETALKVGM